MSEIVIRLAESPADYRACQAAQRAAWGIVEDGYVVPVATMVGAQLHGGLVLGAFLADGQAVGLSFAFLGRTEHGRTCLYSQLTGVIPGYQDHGIGGKLKRLQWEIAKARGIELLCWSFDPLQAGNARFNLDKLGATSNRYVIDMYGPRSDALNTGTPTDRLIVEWETEPKNCTTELSDERLIKIPHSITDLRRTDPVNAARIQQNVRHSFIDAFAQGFRAEGFLNRDESRTLHCYYLLRRRSIPDSPSNR